MFPFQNRKATCVEIDLFSFKIKKQFTSVEIEALSFVNFAK